MTIAVGQDAPDRAQRDESAQGVSLADPRGNPVVLVRAPMSAAERATVAIDRGHLACDIDNAMREARDHSAVAQHIK